MKLILLRIPDAAWPVFRHAAAASFTMARCTDAEVVHWIYLNLGVDVFGKGMYGHKQLIDLGVTISGPDLVAPATYPGGNVKPSTLDELIEIARYVSRGRGYIGLEPYPDAQARRVLGEIGAAVPVPVTATSPGGDVSLATDLGFWTRSLSCPPLAREVCERALAVVEAASAVVAAAPAGIPVATCQIPAALINQLEAALAPASQPEGPK